MGNKPLNIAVIVPYPVFPAKMGGQKGIALFYEHLGKENNVTLFCTSDTNAGNFPARIFPILGSSKLRYINPFLIFRLFRIIKAEKFTHLIIEHPYFGWLGFFLKQLTGIPLIIHSHNIEYRRFQSTGKWWWRILMHYEKFVHRQADLNFFITGNDRGYAIEKFNLKAEKCITITYGMDLSHLPSTTETQAARAWLCEKYGIADNERIYLFNGTLDYKPNLDAVLTIVNDINPILLNSSFRYKILICGRNLPADMNSLENYQNLNIIYAGFVEDISIYFKGSDAFINPVIDGGGIKTKLVEALGYNLFCISTTSGAVGIPQAVTDGKMVVIEDYNWGSFAVNMQIEYNKETPSRFFEYFYWGNIAKKATDAILELLPA